MSTTAEARERMSKTVEANAGDTIVNTEGEEWIIDKRMFIVLPEGATLHRTGNTPVVMRNPVFRNLKLHSYEGEND